ncbi:hypothetical protein [Ekhidna sp.]|uniref:hypothetical protein n=1 Tax=Ekhidna sp. TaxID=2608089 RepID=UPI003514C16D
MKYPLIILLLFYIAQLFAQDGVSIGRPSPQPGAIFQVTAPERNKGVLLPYAHTSMIRGGMDGETNGLIVYDSVFNRFAYYKADSWIYLNPWDTEGVDPDMDAIPSDITYITTPYEVRVNNDLSANRLSGFGVIPIGGIIMWSGNVADIPPNFQLCDGTGITPNLSGKFIRAGGSPGSAGGSDGLNTTNISYERKSKYITGAGCETDPYLFDIEYVERCETDPGTGETIDYNRSVSNIRASSCAEARATISPSKATCEIIQWTSCTQKDNPNYYRTNPACIDSSVSEVEAVTTTDNRPAYFELAFIMRVE